MLFPRKSLSRSVLLLFMSCLWGVLQTESVFLSAWRCPVPYPARRSELEVQQVTASTVAEQEENAPNEGGWLTELWHT